MHAAQGHKLYKPPGVFLILVDHEGNGLIVSDSTDEWVQAMSLLIEDKSYRNSLAKQAKRDVLEHHMLPTHLDKWERVLGEFSSRIRTEL